VDALPTSGPGVGNFNGTIEDAIVDIDTGDILYIVVNAAFDEGERWIPIPLSFFQWDATNKRSSSAGLGNLPSLPHGMMSTAGCPLIAAIA
jgi:hypothetical protein